MDGDDLLIGTFSQGLDLMNLRTGKVVNYRNVPGDSASLCNDYVYAIFRASDGTLYVGTMSGMCTFDKRRGRFSRVKITEGRFIYDIAEDTGGNIWVASKVSGIYRYSPGDGTWKNYRHDELDPRSPADDRYIRVYVDTGGQVWFCGESAGICRYDPPMDGFENFGADDNLRTASTTACWTTARATCGSPPTKASSNTTPSCTPAHATRSRTDSRATSSISGRRTKPGTERSSSGE